MFISNINNFQKYLLYFFIHISLINIIINQDNLFIKNLNLDYVHALSLINGNIFILHKNGVIVYNYNFTIKLYDYNFNGNILIPTMLDNNLTSIIQSSDDINQYVLAIINNNIYIFSSKGLYLFHFTHTLLSDFPNNSIYQYYSLLYYKCNNNIYSYIISFLNNQKYPELTEFEINMDNHSYKINNKEIYDISNIISDSISCQIYNNFQNKKNIDCFYIKLDNEINVISFFLIEIENNYQIIRNDKIDGIVVQGKNHLIKSVIGKDGLQAIIDIIHPKISTFNWLAFNLNSFQYSALNHGTVCLMGTYLNRIYYFNYIEQYIFACKNANGVSLSTIKFNPNINGLIPDNYNQIIFSDCTDFINLNIIFLLYEGKYMLINTFICNTTSTQVYSFPFSIYEYEKPSSQPDSEFLYIPTTIPTITSLNTNSYTTSLTTIPTINTLTTNPYMISLTTIPYISIIHSLTTTLYLYPTIPSLISQNNCQLKCFECNEESKILDLCIKCNTKKGFFPSKINGINYYECYNEETKPINYFFNNNIKFYEPCYSYCKTCKNQGNDEKNNCTSCRNNYIFRPDEINSSNCVLKCQYYYYISFDQYFCSENNQCPAEASYLIRDKGKCIDNCFNDNEYKYQFNYECYKECPEDSIEEGDYICRIKNKKKCYLYNDFFFNVNYKDLEANHFDNLIKRYIKGFSDTDFHIDFYQSQNYTITIYKTMECLKELEMISTIIEFGECYKNVQEKYNFNGRKLIILISDFFNDKKLVNTIFHFFNPDTGEQLLIDEICKDANYKIEKSLTYYPEVDIIQAKFFQNQDINIFNSSELFYNDLCYYFESPNGKDVPLKERLLLFYPNVTLCDGNCNNIGVNLTTMKALCECKFKEIIDEAKEASKLVGLDYTNLIESLSLDVLKCYKTLFQLKYFIRCYGGLICIILIIAQTICVIITIKISLNKIKKITFIILEKYSVSLKSQSGGKSPPKKTTKKNKDLYITDNYNLSSEIKYKGGNITLKNIKSDKERKEKNRKKFKIDNNILSSKTKFQQVSVSEAKLDGDVNLKEYLKTSMDELDYDELVDRENRSFCKIYIDKLIVSQMFIDLFFNKNWIIPKTIKIIFIIIMIDSYMFVNALFYNEDYIMNLYHLDKKESAFSFVPRSINRIIYTSVASSILEFIISLLFPTENKIKKMLIRKKNNRKEMKKKVFESMNNIVNNYRIFIIISYIVTCFSWYYISCFNNAYPYLKNEWIKSSFFIIFIMQIVSFLSILLFAILRIISIKCRNEKIFRLSNYFFS